MDPLRTVFTNGCFDIITTAHVNLLGFCAAWSNNCRVVVGLNSDESVRKLKGPNRPINNQEFREEVLRGIKGVTDVIVFDQTTVTKLLLTLKPDVWMKGGDYTLDTLNQEEVAAAKNIGAQIHFLPWRENIGTTDIIRRIEQNARRPVAMDLYSCRHSVARLLIAYSRRLMGTWYQDTARDCGIELDAIGHIKGYRDPLDGPLNQRALEQLEEIVNKYELPRKTDHGRENS